MHEQTPNEITPAELRLAAMNLLARREHLRAELAVKLSKRFGPELDLEPVLDQLEQDNLLCDQRFVESYLRYRSTSGYGPARIEQELRQKGAPASMVSEAMAESDTDWQALAREVRLKKFGPDEPADFREKSRQLRFLQYRGFTGEQTGVAFLDD